MPTIAHFLVSVPPTLPAACGYGGNARLLALYIDYDKLCWSDGQCSATGYWPGWRGFSRHPAIKPRLAGLDFGGADTPAKHWLILDTIEQKAFVLPPAEARTFLPQQHQQRAALVGAQSQKESADKPVFSDTEVQTMIADGVSEFHKAKWARAVPALAPGECELACDQMLAFLAALRG